MKDTKDNGKLSLYGREPEGAVELEVARIPLQDQVAMVRRAGCALWRHTKVGWRSLQDGLQSRVGKARSRTKESLSSVGLTDTTLVLKSTAIGSTFLLGLFLARRHPSLTGRLAWPVLGAGLVGVVLYLPSAEQRGRAVSSVRGVEEQWRERVVQWRRRRGKAEEETQSSDGTKR